MQKAIALLVLFIPLASLAEWDSLTRTEYVAGTNKLGQEITAASSNAVDLTARAGVSSNAADIAANAAAIPTNVSQLSNDSGYLTTIDGLSNSGLVNDAGYALGSSVPTNVSQLSNDSGYLTTIDGLSNSGLVNDAGYALASSVPTNVSQLSNDAGYLTTIDGLSNSGLVNDAGYITQGGVPVDARDVTNTVNMNTNALTNVLSIAFSGGGIIRGNTNATDMGVSTFDNDAGYTSSNSAQTDYSGAGQYLGKIGITNSEAPAGTYHMLFVQASTNGSINHAIVAHCGPQSNPNRVGALHVYANTNGSGTAIHIMKIGKSPTGGGEIQLMDADGNEVIDIDADSGEIDLIGQVIARDPTGSGVTPNAAANSFVVDSSSLNAGITLSSTNGGNANIYFATLSDGNKAAHVQYISSVDKLRLGVANVTRLEVTTTGVDLTGDCNVASNAVSGTDIVNRQTMDLAMGGKVENQPVDYRSVTQNVDMASFSLTNATAIGFANGSQISGASNTTTVGVGIFVDDGTYVVPSDSVTSLSDVSSAGSGAIITGAERSKLAGLFGQATNQPSCWLYGTSTVTLASSQWTTMSYQITNGSASVASIGTGVDDGYDTSSFLNAADSYQSVKFDVAGTGLYSVHASSRANPLDQNSRVICKIMHKGSGFTNECARNQSSVVRVGGTTGWAFCTSEVAIRNTNETVFVQVYVDDVADADEPRRIIVRRVRDLP